MEGSGWMCSAEMEKADWEVSWKPTIEGSQTEKDFPYPHLLSPRNKLTKGLLLLKFAAVVSLQWCQTLCDPRDGSPPGSSVPGIFQARALEWVAIAFFSSSLQEY